MPLARYYIKSAENPWKTIPLKKYKKIMFFFFKTRVYNRKEVKKKATKYTLPAYLHA